MLLKVSPKTAIWGIDNLWFTLADKEPHEIDLDQFSDKSKEIINKAIKTGELLVVSDKQSVQIVENLDFLSILNGSTTSIKREVSLIKDINKLTKLTEHETKNKNRTTVLKAINNQLGKLLPTSSYDLMVLDTESKTVTITRANPMIISEETVQSEELVAT